MADTSTEIKNNEVSADVAAFQADVELEKYRQRVETGALTEEEKEDRKQVLDFLGFSG
jgi:hypothetical protein